MKSFNFWLKLSVFNFFILAFLGVVMRYKIAFSFPFLEQKYLQESHSHFAFYGWISQTIYLFIIEFVHKSFPKKSLKKYYTLLKINFTASIIMLLSFLYGGYFSVSIIASTAALFTSFFFFFYYKKDFYKSKGFTKKWFLAGLFFAVLSSLGVFTLSFMIATKNINQNIYLASQFFYLHFQYNGFFIFSCIGFLINSLKEKNINITLIAEKSIFWLLFFSCIIGYGLSILWLKLPLFIYLIILAASIFQVIASFKLTKIISINWKFILQKFSTIEIQLLVISGVAFLVKILLQLGSTIPQIHQFAFGIRNVVIAYLHLVLLMCISIFLMSKIIFSSHFKIIKPLINSVKLLVLGIVLNELLLGLIGIFSIQYFTISYASYFLFAFSILILFSIVLILKNLKKA